MEYYFDYHKRINEFSMEFRKIVESNKKHEIKNLVASDAYSTLTLEEKEEQIFISALIDNNEEILKYLIFNYKIKEDYFLKWYKNKSDRTINILGVSNFQEVVKQMFQSRKLKEDLSIELDEKNSINKSKSKV